MFYDIKGIMHFVLFRYNLLQCLIMNKKSKKIYIHKKKHVAINFTHYSFNTADFCCRTTLSFVNRYTCAIFGLQLIDDSAPYLAMLSEQS